MAVDPERFEQGMAVYREVYGPDAFGMEHGQSDFFDLMISHLFGEVWSRPALPIPIRRMLVIGVLAAQNHFDTLKVQFLRALTAGELTADEVREIALQLIPYVGYPSSSALFRVSEEAIATHRKATT